MAPLYATACNVKSIVHCTDLSIPHATANKLQMKRMDFERNITPAELGDAEDPVLYFPHHTSLYVRMLLQFFYTGKLDAVL